VPMLLGRLFLLSSAGSRLLAEIHVYIYMYVCVCVLGSEGLRAMAGEDVKSPVWRLRPRRPPRPNLRWAIFSYHYQVPASRLRYGRYPKNVSTTIPEPRRPEDRPDASSKPLPLPCLSSHRQVDAIRHESNQDRVGSW
jgi:hypothetical protein